MLKTWLLCLAAVLTAQSATAQERYGAWGGDGTSAEGKTQGLVDELRGLIDEADRARAADPRFLRDLRQILRRYDYPWGARLIEEDFRDGDYTGNPAWVVASGTFSVAWGGGLTSTVRDTVVAPEAQRPRERVRTEDLAAAVLGQLLGGRPRESAPPPSAPRVIPAEVGEIFLPVKITNAFAITATLGGRPIEQAGGLDLAVYQGAARQSGYALRHVPGQGITMLRYSARGAAIVEAGGTAIDLTDGAEHVLSWTRTGDGEMAVAMDDTILFTTSDRGFKDPFDGFAMMNRGGDYLLRSITIDGTR